MTKLLLVSPKTEQLKGGIAVWTDASLENCKQYGIDCDFLNIATIGMCQSMESGAERIDLFDQLPYGNKIVFDSIAVT